MTPRVEFILRRIMDVLHTMPDRQCNARVLKSSVDLLVAPNTLASEFEDALKSGEAMGWFIGLRPSLGPIKWSLTDRGEAAYLQGLE